MITQKQLIKTLCDHPYQENNRETLRGGLWVNDSVTNQYHSIYSFTHENYIITRVKQHGGSDQGSDWYVIFSVRDNDTTEVTYWCIPGWYASYDGATINWDELYEVIPTPETIIVYKKK